jgi:hypothetical protein
MGWLDVLVPTVLGEAAIRVLPPATARTVNVRIVVNRLKLAKHNEFAEATVPGLSGGPLQFVRGRSRTLSAVLSFDGRPTNTDVRQLMKPVTDLMNVDGQMHAPPVLSFDWRGWSVQCVLEIAVAEFRSVFSDGRPSRGRLRVVFRERRTLAELEQDAGRQ